MSCHENNHHHHPEACHGAAAAQEDGECNMPEKLLQMADQAWAELMLEAIKDEMRQHCGEHIKSVAKLVAKTNKEKWETKIASKAHCHNYKQALWQLMSPGQEHGSSCSV